MKVAYVLESPHAQNILTNMIIPQMEKEMHGADVVGMFFIMDNTYFLMKGTETAERLKKLSEKTGLVLLACDKCAKERKIEDKLIKEAAIGCFPVCYAALDSAGVDHIITI
ncbi:MULTISPECIES: DsrE-related protein SaoD [Clostridium]|uniref:DsrE-related protein SaoD n=1 Tax=Clostridium TaxID=1485 RepID=UPI0005F91760|nr:MULTISPECIES: DsrE-related protein SaoD [Clostridium]APF28562.1 dsrE/DsrF-like family protein [Clostridium sporogenes]MDI6921381.1 DsrE-related protein SaoD [Clostridium botulinum]WMU97301.1 DsrE-related protein SaoD [Clostridium botulinum]